MISMDEAKEIAGGISAALGGDNSLLDRAYELATVTLMESIQQWHWECDAFV